MKEENSICYVTMFLDIGRANWKNVFNRTFDQYLKDFEPYIPLFNKKNCKGDLLLVFIDKKWEQKLIDKINSYKIDDNNFNIKIVAIDDKFMELLPMWQTLKKERQIINSEHFKNIIGHRHIYPEHMYPEYTLINHCKIDLICSVIDSNKINYNYYCWVDFGFFKLKKNIPENLLDITKFNLDKINYTLLNYIDDNDSDVYFTLHYAPEKIGGYFFFGRQDKLKDYQKLYHEILDYFQNTLNIVDDDQHLALQCYFRKPELFTLHYIKEWHSVLVKFQKK
jgi:hypothetical protein